MVAGRPKICLATSKSASKDNCSMTRTTNYYCRMPLRIMRKPYKTPEYRKEDPNQWMVKGLRLNQVRRVIWK